MGIPIRLVASAVRRTGRGIRPGALVGAILAALAIAGCGMVPFAQGPPFGQAQPAPSMGIDAKGSPVATGVTNGITWTMHAWTESRTDGAFICTSFETTDRSGGAGCGNGTVGSRDLDLARQVADRLISLTGLVGTEIVKVRVHYGDGSVTEHLTLPSPVPGTRVAAIVLPAAPVPTFIEGLGASGAILARTDL